MSTQAMDELICSQVFSKMCLKLDKLDDEGVTQFFTDDGVWHRQGKTLNGRKEMLQALNERPTNLFVQHILHQLVCEHVDSGHIKASAYMTVYRKAYPEKVVPPLPAQAPDMLIIWDAEFTRKGDSWLISHLDNKPLYRG